MNVYKINNYTIAAKNADEALSYYFDESCFLDGLYFGQLEDGEEDSVEIKIKRLTDKEKNREYITCCFDGCDECEDKDEPVLHSCNELLDNNTQFPCVICLEE